MVRLIICCSRILKGVEIILFNISPSSWLAVDDGVVSEVFSFLTASWELE